MTHSSCPGYGSAPWRALVDDYPADPVYPSTAFRTEWGPIFHRGRLDGTARVLVIGQDPAQHESVARRILVGEAGQRLQGFLTKLGIDTSYVMVNTFLYSLLGSKGSSSVDAAGLLDYRNRWLDAAADAGPLHAVVSLGTLADTAYKHWPRATGAAWTYQNILHPTYPDSASASGSITFAAAMKRLCQSWNAALDVLAASGLAPDAHRPLVHYGDAITPAEHTEIPEADLPAGMPAWMRGLDPWAKRTGATPAAKRMTITVTVPASAQP